MFDDDGNRLSNERVFVEMVRIVNRPLGEANILVAHPCKDVRFCRMKFRVRPAHAKHLREIIRVKTTKTLRTHNK